MSFSPSAIVIPKQKRSMTPDVFITDQYGKEPAPHGDGKLTINEAVRLSKIVDGITTAFTTNDNRIIWGLDLDPDSLKLSPEGDLSFKITAGTGIVNQIIFNLPEPIEVVWTQFKQFIPSTIPNGQLLLYFTHHDSIQDTIDRPLPQNDVRYPTRKYPGNQYEFDPVKICGAYYNPNDKKTYNSEWDPNESKILITSNLKYEVDQYGEVSIVYEEQKKELNVDQTIDSHETLIQQGGGYYDNHLIDGGKLTLVRSSDKKPNGIFLIYDGICQSADEVITLPSGVSITDDIYVFFNGVLYFNNVDYIITNNRQIKFFPKSGFFPGGRFYIFKNIDENEYGYLRTVFHNPLDNKISFKALKNDTFKKDMNYLLLSDSGFDGSYDIKSDGLIIFKDTMPKYCNFSLTEIHEGNSIFNNWIKVYYNDICPVNSSNMSVYGLTSDRCYLVFYNGVLYLEGTDYSISTNTIIFKNLVLKNGKKLLILGV